MNKFALDTFLKERTLSDKLIFIIGALLFTLFGWLIKSPYLSNTLDIIVKIIPIKDLIVVATFIILLLLLIVVILSSKLIKLKSKLKFPYLKKTFAPLNNIDVMFMYKNPYLFPNLAPIDIVAQATPRFICDICGYEILDSNGDGIWECHCKGDSYTSVDITQSLEAARRDLLFTLDKPICRQV